MCFSATASFVAGGALGAAGVETIRHAKTKNRFLLAAMPMLFGIQQAIEGVVWISFGTPWLNSLATHSFVFFSHVLWPTYFPIAILLIEKKKSRRLILKVLLLIGLATSITLLYYSLILSNPISQIIGNSIVYTTSLPAIPLGIGFYVLATSVTAMVSSHKMIRVFGMSLLASFAMAYWAYQEAFYSVWCFFAAIFSLIIYVHLRTNSVERLKEAIMDKLPKKLQR